MQRIQELLIRNNPDLLKNKTGNKAKVINPITFAGLNYQERQKYIVRYRRDNFNIELADKVVEYFVKYYDFKDRRLIFSKSKEWYIADMKQWIVYILVNLGFSWGGIAKYMDFSKGNVNKSLKAMSDKITLKEYKKDYPAHVEYFKKNFDMFVEQK